MEHRQLCAELLAEPGGVRGSAGLQAAICRQEYLVDCHCGRWLLDVSTNSKHWARNIAKNLLGHGSKEQFRQSCAAMRSQNQEIDFIPCRHIGNHFPDSVPT